MPNFDFQFDENDIPGSLSKLMRYLKWFNANLDDTNIRYLAWGDSIVDNVDDTHKLKLKFYVPDGVLKVQKLSLNFTVEEFRAYEKGTSSGGGSTSGGGGGSSTSSGSSTTTTTGTGINVTWGDAATSTDSGHFHTYQRVTGHNHSMEHTHTIELLDHTHSVPSHSHGIDYGIYESSAATGCLVYVDGVLRLDNGGSGYIADQANLDLTEWVTTSGWHTIEISSTTLGRINGAYFIQVYAKGLS